MLEIKMDFQAAWVKVKVTVANFRKKCYSAYIY